MFGWDGAGAEKTSGKHLGSKKGFSAPMGRAAVSEEQVNMRRRPGCCSVSCLYWLGNAFPECPTLSRRNLVPYLSRGLSDAATSDPMIWSLPKL